MNSSDINTLGIVGTGAMGRGIAQIAAQHCSQMASCVEARFYLAGC